MYNYNILCICNVMSRVFYHECRTLNTSVIFKQDWLLTNNCRQFLTVIIILIIIICVHVTTCTLAL